MKIATLLFLLIYSLPFARAPFSWAARHTTVCLDVFAVLCVSWPVYVVCVDSVFNASVLLEFFLFKDDAPMRLKKIHHN